MKTISMQSGCSLMPASMEKEKMLSAKIPIAVTAVLALVASFATTAAAQSDALRKLYETSATIPTNVESIHAYPAPPAGFDSLSASDEDLAAYGIPLRPDKVQDPEGYRHWTRVAQLMGNPHSRWYGELKPRPVHGALATAVPSSKQAQDTTFGATSVSGHGWSGVVNTVPGTTWSSSKSFSSVQGEFNVPAPQQAFASGGQSDICDGGTDMASFWVGLGGLSVTGKNLGNQNNVAQTGVDIYAFCNVQVGANFGAYAWEEWYPGPSVQLFDVNPADDISVSVEDTSSTAAAFFIVDFTIQQSASFTITAPADTKLVGNEAEYIVERPGGDSTPTGLYPLANYIWSFWDFSRAKAFTGTYYYPGETSATTYDVSMTDDSGANIISVPNIDKGLQNLFVQDQGCAYSLGCTP
jgi:hypothetical protein